MKQLLLLLILVFVSSAPGQATEQELKIAMLLWRGETRAEVGFKKGLQDFGYKTILKIYDCNQDLSKLGAILHSLKSNLGEYDYLYTFGTTVSRRTKLVIGGEIPQIFNIVTDPVAAGIVNSIDVPGKWISGGSDKIEITVQLDKALQLFGISKLGFIYNPREKNSLIIREELYRFGMDQGVEIIDLRSPPAHNALEQNLVKLINNPGMVDAVYLAPDSYLSSEATFIGTQLRKARVKSITQVRSLIEQGVLLGIAGDYYELGLAVASIVDRHQKGQELEKIPVEHFSDYTLIINQTTADILDLKIDQTVGVKTELVK